MFGKLLIFSVLIVGTFGILPPDWVKYMFPPYNPWHLGKCRSNSYTEGFRSDLYFQGEWHIKSMLGNMLLHTDKCLTMVSETKGEEAEVLGYLFEPRLNKYLHLRGSVNLTEVEVSSYVVKFDVAPGLPPLKLHFDVLDTDYMNYAIVYFCQESFGLCSESSWVLTRQPGDKRHDDQINKILKLAGMKPTEFKEIEAMNCPPNHPRL